MIDIKTLNDVIIFTIKVIPGASKSMFCALDEGILKLKLNSPPIDGKANRECVLLLSKALKVPKSSIKIVAGEKSKIKKIQICGDVESIKNKLEEIASSLE